MDEGSGDVAVRTLMPGRCVASCMAPFMHPNSEYGARDGHVDLGKVLGGPTTESTWMDELIAKVTQQREVFSIFHTITTPSVYP